MFQLRTDLLDFVRFFSCVLSMVEIRFFEDLVECVQRSLKNLNNQFQASKYMDEYLSFTFH